MRNFSRLGICTAILLLVVGVAAISAQEPARPDPSVDQSQQQAQPQQTVEPQAEPSKIDQSRVDQTTKTDTERTDTMRTDQTEGSELPRTASNLLLAALGGFLSLGAGLFLRSNRRRS